MNSHRSASVVLSLPILAALLLGTSRASGGAATCQIVNVTPISFGAYASGGRTHMDSVGEIEVSCSAQMPLRISFGPSISGSESPREMRAAGGSLLYNLFMDAARAIMWGDGSQGTQSYLAFVRAGQILRLPIFGRVFGAQAIPAGNYRDRLIVTLVF